MVDGVEKNLAAETVTAGVFGDAHLGEFVLAGIHGQQCAAAGGLSVEQGHDDVTARGDDLAKGVAQNETVGIFEGEKLSDPGFIEFAEGECVGG